MPLFCFLSNVSMLSPTVVIKVEHLLTNQGHASFLGSRLFCLGARGLMYSISIRSKPMVSIKCSWVKRVWPNSSHSRWFFASHSGRDKSNSFSASCIASVGSSLVQGAVACLMMRCPLMILTHRLDECKSVSSLAFMIPL